MADGRKNLAYTTVLTAPSPATSGTSMTLASGGGALMPSTPFNATVWPTGTIPTAANAEIVRVTNVAGDVLTITRAQESTTARTIVTGDQFAATITVKAFDDIEAAKAGLGFTSTTQAGTAFGGTLSTNGLSLAVPAVLTTARASNDAIGLNTAKTNATWTVNSSGISFDGGGYLTTAMASNRGSDFVQATAVFAGTNATGTIASGGISVSVAPTSSVVGTSGISLSSNGSSVSIYVTGSNANGVSFGYSNGALTGSVQTSYRASNDAIGLNTAKTNVTWTVNSSGLSLDAGGYAGTGLTTTTTAGTAIVGTNNTAGLSLGVPTIVTNALTNIRVSAGATSNLLSAMTFSNGSGVSWGISASTITASVDPTSSLVGTSGISISTNGSTASWLITASNANNVSFGFSGASVLTGSFALNISACTTSNNLSGLTLSNSNGVTFGLNASTVTASIAPLTAGVSNLGDTYGTTGLVSQQLVLVPGGHNIMSQTKNGESATLSIIGVPPIVSTFGNTLGVTGLNMGVPFLIGANNLTISVSTLTQAFGGVTRTNEYITFLDPPAMSQFDPFNNAPVTNSTLGQSTVYFVPFDVPYPISASRINFFFSNTHTFSGAPNNSTAWLAAGYAIYTRMTGTGSDRISLLTSYSLSHVSASASSSTRLSVTNYIGLSNATSHSTSQYGVNNATVTDYLGSSIAGYRVLALPLNTTLAPGRSWLAFSIQSASQGASLILGQSVLQNQYSNNLAYRPYGAVSAASNANMYGASDGLGIYSAQTAAFPNSVPLTSDSIRLSNVATLPYFNFSGIGTSSNIL